MFLVCSLVCCFVTLLVLVFCGLLCSFFLVAFCGLLWVSVFDFDLVLGFEVVLMVTICWCFWISVVGLFSGWVVACLCGVAVCVWFLWLPVLRLSVGFYLLCSVLVCLLFCFTLKLVFV